MDKDQYVNRGMSVICGWNGMGIGRVLHKELTGSMYLSGVGGISNKSIDQESLGK